ncbi:MAG: PAS domain S-box protein [Saprospiraceae bacterium]
MTNQKQFIIDYATLYKFSHTIANTLGFERACINFLHEFTEVEAISFASIWLKEDGKYRLFDVYDRSNNSNDSIAKIDNLVVPTDDFGIYTVQDKDFEQVKHRNDITSGSYFVCNLSNAGCLQFYTEEAFLFPNENLERLEPIFKQLSKRIHQEWFRKHHYEIKNKLCHKNAQLKKQVDLSYNVANNLLEGLIITDTENNITFVNDRMCRITGFKSEELIGEKAYKMLMPKEEWKYVESMLALEDKTKLRGFLERKGLKKDGSIWYGLICNSPLFNENGVFLGLSMTILNITKRREVEKEKNALLKALSESEYKYRRVVQNLSEGVIMTDLEDRVTFVNQQMCDLTGYTESEIIGQKAYELLLPKEEWQSSERRLEEREDGVSENYIKLHLRKDGSTWWGSINASPLVDENETVIGTLAAVMNITAQFEVEQEREALVQELAEKNKDLDDFAYIVSHDLKAPLRAIKTLSEWIYEDYAEILGDDGQHQMKLLQNRVTRMHQFIESLLEFSRLGHTSIPKETFDLNESILQIIDSFQPLEDFEIKITTNLPTIVGEKVRIEQVFQNLISNGMKYNDKPKGLIEISHQETKDYYTFKVADNGKGIDKKYFEKIFQIFQTLEARDSYESTGIGLTIVKKIVESHDGKVTLESEVGKGTIFIFTIKRIPNNNNKNKK